MKIPKNPKVVEIEWLDSHCNLNWERDEECNPPDLLCTSIGFLLHEDDESVSITTTLCKHQAFDPLTIPQRAVIRMWTIDKDTLCLSSSDSPHPNGLEDKP